MKLIVFSDSHGVSDNMVRAVKREKPDLCFFLGDGERDAARVQRQFGTLPFYTVRGNCDVRSSLSSALVCSAGGVCIFATHGHLYNVKYEPALDSLCAAARDEGAQLALFGHTHHACCLQREGLTLLNPGTIGHTAQPRYALVSVEDGRFTAELKTLPL